MSRLSRIRTRIRKRRHSKTNFLLFVRDIIRRHRQGISLVLFLVVLAKVAWVIEPTVFGRVIDAMIQTARTPAIGFLWPLLIWAAVFLVNSCAGTLQRVFEARVYNRMFAEMAKKIAASATNSAEPPTRVAARTELAREFVTFFQKRLPDIVEEVFDLGQVLEGRLIDSNPRPAYFWAVPKPLCPSFDVGTIKKFCGHSSVVISERYLHPCYQHAANLPNVETCPCFGRLSTKPSLPVRTSR